MFLHLKMQCLCLWAILALFMPSLGQQTTAWQTTTPLPITTSLLLFNVPIRQSTVSTGPGEDVVVSQLPNPTYDASVITANATATVFALACATPTSTPSSGFSCELQNATVVVGQNQYVHLVFWTLSTMKPLTMNRNIARQPRTVLSTSNAPRSPRVSIHRCLPKPWRQESRV